MMGYISDPRKFNWKLLQLINTFSKVDRHKINSQKSVAILYINEKQTEKGTTQTTPFTTVSNNTKYVEGDSSKANERMT